VPSHLLQGSFFEVFVIDALKFSFRVPINR